MPERLDLGQRFARGAFADRHHRNHRRDAEHDAQHAQRGAQAIAAQRLDRDAEVLAELSEVEAHWGQGGPGGPPRRLEAR